MIEHLAEFRFGSWLPKDLAPASAGQLLAMFTGCTTWHCTVVSHWTLDSEQQLCAQWTLNKLCARMWSEFRQVCNIIQTAVLAHDGLGERRTWHCSLCMHRSEWTLESVLCAHFVLWVLARVCSRVNCSQQLLAEGGLGAGSSCCLAVRPPQHRLHLNFTHRTSVFNWRRFKPHLSKSGFHQTGAIGHTSVKIQDTLHPAWLDRQTFFSEQLLLWLHSLIRLGPIKKKRPQAVQTSWEKQLSLGRRLWRTMSEWR